MPHTCRRNRFWTRRLAEDRIRNASAASRAAAARDTARLRAHGFSARLEVADDGADSVRIEQRVGLHGVRQRLGFRRRRIQRSHHFAPVLAQLLDWHLVDLGPQVRQQALHLAADARHVHLFEAGVEFLQRPVERGKRRPEFLHRVPHVDVVDGVHDAVDRIEHAGQRAGRRRNVVVARRPPDFQGRLAIRLRHVIQLGEIQSRDPLRLQHDTQALLDGLMDDRTKVFLEHPVENLHIHLHFQIDVIQPSAIRLGPVFVEAEIDAGHAPDRHAAELDRGSDVHSLDRAIHVGLEVNPRTEHASRAEKNQAARQQGESDENEDPDFEIFGVGRHGFRLQRLSAAPCGKTPAHSHPMDGREVQPASLRPRSSPSPE